MTEHHTRLPISKAANSYELIDEVIAVIEAEPRRLRMDYNTATKPSYVRTRYRRS